MNALRTCGSCCGSPSSTRLRAAVPIGDGVGERDLAGFVDEEVVERLSIPSRENSQDVPAMSAARAASHVLVLVVFSINVPSKPIVLVRCAS